jgi:hypothetical protein
MKVRTMAILLHEQSLPTVSRREQPVGVYTKDFSRRGCGFLAAQQMYPEEIVRILLPNFWIRLHIVRARRVGPSCYEMGGELMEQHQPSDGAFDVSMQAEPAL